MKLLSIIAGILCFSPGMNTLLAQGSDASTVKVFPEIRYAYGFVIRHHLDMGSYTREQFPATELAMVMPVSGSKRWHQEYHFPDIGFSYWYSNLGNSSVLGDVHAMFAWMKLPIVENKRWSWNYRIGSGLGYFRKKFDIESNYKNLAIGSHLNANIQLLTEVRLFLNQYVTLSAGLGLAHFSNGTMIAPNYGINVPNVNAALFLHSKNYRNHVNPTAFPDVRPFNYFDVNISHGVKQIRPLLGPSYHVFSGSLLFYRRFNYRRSYGPALDIFYDQSEKPLLEREGKTVSSAYRLLKPGISGNAQFDFGNLSVQLALGGYLYQEERSDGFLYDKLGLKYNLADRYFIQLYLKTHYARADYIGWGLGMKINARSK